MKIRIFSAASERFLPREPEPAGRGELYGETTLRRRTRRTIDRRTDAMIRVTAT
jgi:hypothetical protein